MNTLMDTPNAPPFAPAPCLRPLIVLVLPQWPLASCRFFSVFRASPARGKGLLGVFFCFAQLLFFSFPPSMNSFVNFYLPVMLSLFVAWTTELFAEQVSDESPHIFLQHDQTPLIPTILIFFSSPTPPPHLTARSDRVPPQMAPNGAHSPFGLPSPFALGQLPLPFIRRTQILDIYIYSLRGKINLF